MGYILTSESLSQSARKLGDALDMGVFTDPQECPPMIRWGTSLGIWANDRSINSANTIKTAGNKLNFLKLLEARGIPCVEMHKGHRPDRYPVVMRKLLNSYGGRGIEIAEGPEQFLDGVAWSYYYNFSFELGVHCFGGRIIRIFKKVPNEKNKYNILHNDNSHFSLRRADFYPKLPPIMNEMCNLFGVHFGRYDIGWDSDNKTYRIIELNTAPGISDNDNTFNAYVEEFKRWL